MNPVIAVIGGGPAGIAAAVQLKRFDLNPCLFEKERLGGLLWNAQWVENYPGFYRGISGPQLAKRLKYHLEAYNAQVIYENIKQLDYDSAHERFSLSTTENSYSASIIVVASGTAANPGDLPGLMPAELKKNVYFEIVPLLKKKRKKILIIGAGDIAFDYALNLSRNNEITLLYRSNEIKALPLLVRRVQANPGINLIGPAVPQKIARGKSKKLAVTFAPPTVADDSAPVTLEFDYIVGAMGRVPQTDFFSNELKARQEALVSGGRFYFAGDVQNGNLRQAAIAAGNGIEVAMKIYRRIKEGL